MSAVLKEEQQAIAPPKRLLTVADYHRMGEAGILGEDDRVELIEGELYQMATIGSRHASQIDHLTELLVRPGSGVVVRVQNPITLGDYSEPEPDLALVRSRADRYRDSHPGITELLLVVEVADATIAADRNWKIPIYAKHGVPEVWLFDVNRRTLEIFREPDPEGYRQVFRPAMTERVAPLALPNLSFEVAELVV
jgi:Uma2 family endonuclease